MPSTLTRTGIRRPLTPALPALLALALPAPAAAQLISGQLLDARTDAPIPAMDVILRDVADERVGRTVSDADGRFWFTVSEPGIYRVAVSRIGYDSTATAPLGVAREQDLFVEIRVHPVALGMDPITVRAQRDIPFLELQGFYARARRGMGSFIGPEEVERLPGRTPTLLLRRVPGVTVTNGRIQMRGTGSVNLSCVPSVVVDGFFLRGQSLDDILTPEMVHAIEVYRGPATVPSRWRGEAACGLVAVWTRH